MKPKSLVHEAQNKFEEVASQTRKRFTQQDRSRSSDATWARGLGWASLAIGLTELLAPRKLEQAMGIGNGQNTGIFRVLGLREIGHGIDILSHRDPTSGVYARVAGDGLDGVLLAKAAAKTRNPRGMATIAAMTMGVVALDLLFAWRLARR